MKKLSLVLAFGAALAAFPAGVAAPADSAVGKIVSGMTFVSNTAAISANRFGDRICDRRPNGRLCALISGRFPRS
ncbi:MAG TPA: hypothetical protein PKY73_04565 [Hyphomonas sp.]|nr:hypothetical protein [Hyphomonas sp.]